MGIVIEVISRSHKVLERHKFETPYITLGRAYDNDVVLTEPHISPDHAVIEKLENGHWVIADTGSENGLYTQKHKRIYGHYVIRSGEIFTLGKLQIRILSTEHPVAETVPLNPVETIITQLGKPTTTFAVLAISVLCFAAVHYMALYSEFEIKPLINEAIVLGLASLTWASIWAFTGRLLKHDARFFAQLTITVLYLICESVFQGAVEILKFNSSSEFWSATIYAILDWLLLLTLLWFNFYIATGLTRYQRRLASASVAFALIALSLFFEYFQENRFSLKPVYVNTLKPPGFYFGQPVSTQAFLQESEKIFIRDFSD